MTDDERDESDGKEAVVVLDFLAHGRTEDDRPQYQKEPLAYVIDTADFQLYELVMDPDTDISIGDSFALGELGDIVRQNPIEYDDLPSGASSELDYAIEEIVEANEQRFVDYYNDAQPITLRLHQLNLLPGIGEKLRNDILDERKRKPFESFDELGERIDGLHNPKEVLVERILEELKEDELKYQLFVRDGEE
jgi:putative nucleotide binding protein